MWCRRRLQVTTRYPGASAKTVIDTVALPNRAAGQRVEDMLYMQSYSGADGTYSLTVTFKIGTDLNFAQVLVQNRVSSALSQLPQSVQNQGVTVQKRSTAILLFVTLTSPNATYDSLFLSNYATIAAGLDDDVSNWLCRRAFVYVSVYWNACPAGVGGARSGGGDLLLCCWIGRPRPADQPTHCSCSIEPIPHRI